MVSGGGELAVALQFHRGQVARGLHGGAQGVRSQLAEGRQHGVHVQDVETGQKAAQQLAECLAHGVAGAVGFFHHAGHFFAEGQALHGGAEFRHGRGCQRHPANRLPADGARHLHFFGTVIGVEDPGVVDLGEIVVFGGQPEYRHRRSAVGREPRGQLHGMQHLINGIRRAGK